MPVKEWFTAIFTCCFAASAKEEDDEGENASKRQSNLLISNVVSIARGRR